MRVIGLFVTVHDEMLQIVRDERFVDLSDSELDELAPLRDIAR